MSKISPVCFHTSFESIQSIHQNDTGKASRNDIFLTQKSALQYGIRSVRLTGAEFLNSIPTTIKESISLVCFLYKLFSSFNFKIPLHAIFLLCIH